MRHVRRPRGTAAPLLAALLGACALLTACAPRVDPPTELRATRAELTASPLDRTLPALAERAHRRGLTLVLPAGTFTAASTVLVPRDARVRLAPGTRIVGEIPGDALVRLSSGVSFSGGVLQNDTKDPGFDLDLAPDAVGVRITGTTFRGANTNSLYLSEPGIRDLVVSRARFEQVTYGILLNAPATDASGIRIEDSTFTRACGDAIEINAATNGTAQRVRDVTVVRNRMEGGCGDSPSAGFGVGFAGVDGFTVRDNRIVGVRNEGVHVEDGTANGSIADNLVAGGGHGDRPGIAIYRETSRIEVTGNTVRDFSGGGIGIRWDGQGSARDVVIRDNEVRRVTGEGIVVAGDTGTGPFTVEGNVLEDVGGDGVAVLGAHERSTVSGNTLRGVQGEPVLRKDRGAGVTVIEENRVE